MSDYIGSADGQPTWQGQSWPFPGTVNGDLDVNGNVFINGADNSFYIEDGDIYVGSHIKPRDIYINRDAYVNRDAYINGDTYFNGDLYLERLSAIPTEQPPGDAIVRLVRIGGKNYLYVSELDYDQYWNPIWAWKALGSVAGQVQFTPAGNISATDVQAAIEELDTEKAPASHDHPLPVITAEPTDTPAEGTMRVANLSGTYYLYVFVNGGWRRTQLT